MEELYFKDIYNTFITVIINEKSQHLK